MSTGPGGMPITKDGLVVHDNLMQTKEEPEKKKDTAAASEERKAEVVKETEFDTKNTSGTGKGPATKPICNGMDNKGECEIHTFA